MNDKHPIHTTLSTNAMRILERYEKELGTKNAVLERALMGMDKFHFRNIHPEEMKTIIKRAKTGIFELDKLLGGGIPEGFVIAVTGPPGTGKTTFSMKFLLEGLKNNKKPEKPENSVLQRSKLPLSAKVLGYLKDNGGEMLRSDVRRHFDLSSQRMSNILKELRKGGRIKKQKNGIIKLA